MNFTDKKENTQTRRDFVKTAGLAAGGLMAAPLISRANYFPRMEDPIRIAVVGCGGRGTGAVVQALSTKQNVQLVAMADAFKEKIDSSLQNIKTAMAKKPGSINVKDEHRFVGFDAYKKAIPLADVVILATPPGFRPLHFEEAVNQNKQIFMEKPVATGPAGIKRVLAAAQKAKEKKLNVVVGLQRHYQNSYRELMKRVHDGMIGDITSAQAWWNGAGVWVHPRQPQWNEMEFQMRNWYYFNWLCGDHIVEQHIHNIDVINWAMSAWPISAQGMGGRQVRTGREYGEIFDHHFVEFHFNNGTMMNSQCRHIKGTMSKVDELVVGTRGKVFYGEGRIEDHKGKVLYQFDFKNENNPYQTEHDELFDAVAKGEFKFWDGERGAKSTMAAIMGRLATYSGEIIELDKAMELNLGYLPDGFGFQTKPPIVPKEDGFYPIAVPGQTKYMP